MHGLFLARRGRTAWTLTTAVLLVVAAGSARADQGAAAGGPAGRSQTISTDRDAAWLYYPTRRPAESVVASVPVDPVPWQSFLPGDDSPGPWWSVDADSARVRWDPGPPMASRYVMLLGPTAYDRPGLYVTRRPGGLWDLWALSDRPITIGAVARSGASVALVHASWEAIRVQRVARSELHMEWKLSAQEPVQLATLHARGPWMEFFVLFDGREEHEMVLLGPAKATPRRMPFRLHVPMSPTNRNVRPMRRSAPVVDTLSADGSTAGGSSGGGGVRSPTR